MGDGVFQVKSTNGDAATQAAKTSINHLIDDLADEYKREQGLGLRNDPQAKQRLKEAAEKAKIELSSTKLIARSQPAVHHGRCGPRPANTWSSKMTRAKLEALAEDLIERPS